MDIIMRGGVWCRGIYCGVVWIRQNSNTKRTIGLFSVKQHKNKGNKQLCYAVYILLILNSTRNIQHITQGQFKGSWASLWAQTFHIFYGRSLPPLGSTAALHAVPGRIKNRPTFHHHPFISAHRTLTTDMCKECVSTEQCILFTPLPSSSVPHPLLTSVSCQGSNRTLSLVFCVPLHHSCHVLDG